jgi:predicted HTH domain antitoxin
MEFLTGNRTINSGTWMPLKEYLACGSMVEQKLNRKELGRKKMQIEIALPDDVARDLTVKWGNLERQILELIVVQAYRDGVISAGKVRQLLGMATRLEVDAFLKQKNALLHYDLEELEADRQTHDALRAEGKLTA